MTATAQIQTGSQLPQYRQEVTALPEAIAGMRRIVAAHVRLWGYGQLADAAALCVSELLANVGKHTDSLDCVLTLERQAAGVRVVVSDTSSALPAVQEPDWAAEDGRGLLVLQGVADAWGAAPTDAGKDVWLELRTPGGSRAVCGERVCLPPHLLSAALYFVSATAGPDDVERDLRCTMEAHGTGDHHALVMDLPDPAGGLWATWTRGHIPAAIFILPDCPAADPAAGDPCCEFAAHPGAHTWQLR